MPRLPVKVALVALTLACAACGRAAITSATVSGVIRDTQGAPQMGALVQILAPNIPGVRSASTDLHGRYLIVGLVPGVYQLRATASLLLPGIRQNVRLRPGGQSVVNLTLGALFDTSAWLPAERRRADEPGDDWQWTLRSAASRPILRMVENGEVVMMSSSATEARRSSTRARAAVSSGNGGFGSGGAHHVLSVDRTLDDGAGVLLRADVGTPTGLPGVAPSVQLEAGYQRHLGFAGAARTVVSYRTHPEMITSSSTSGLQSMSLVSAQQTRLGGLADLEYGTAVSATHTEAFNVAAHPFFRVAAHPVAGWTLGYRMATSRDLQGYADLDSLQSAAPIAMVAKGHLQMESGRHQEISLSHSARRGLLKVSAYRDAVRQIALAGSGELSSKDLTSLAQGQGIQADASTETFRLLASGFTTQGFDLTLTEPITPALWLALNYNTGAGLSTPLAAPSNLSSTLASLRPRTAQSATVALKGRIAPTSTRLRAAYRWQPPRLLTAVDPYAPFSDQAFLSFYVDQPLRLGRFLPPGLEGVVDVTNLLAQGYQPFLSSDGRTLFLSQAPRTVQAGLSYTF